MADSSLEGSSRAGSSLKGSSQAGSFSASGSPAMAVEATLVWNAAVSNFSSTSGWPNLSLISSWSNLSSLLAEPVVGPP